MFGGVTDKVWQSYKECLWEEREDWRRLCYGWPTLMKISKDCNYYDWNPREIISYHHLPKCMEMDSY